MRSDRTSKDALQAEHDAAEELHLIAGATFDRALDKLAAAHVAYRIARADAGDACEDCSQALTWAADEALEARQDALGAFILAQNAHADAINAWAPLYNRLKALQAADPKVISLEMH